MNRFGPTNSLSELKSKFQMYRAHSNVSILRARHSQHFNAETLTEPQTNGPSSQVDSPDELEKKTASDVSALLRGVCALGRGVSALFAGFCEKLVSVCLSFDSKSFPLTALYQTKAFLVLVSIALCVGALLVFAVGYGEFKDESTSGTTNMMEFKGLVADVAMHYPALYSAVLPFLEHSTIYGQCNISSSCTGILYVLPRFRTCIAACDKTCSVLHLLAVHRAYRRFE
jgi:hypothetical protein